MTTRNFQLAMYMWTSGEEGGVPVSIYWEFLPLQLPSILLTANDYTK